MSFIYPRTIAITRPTQPTGIGAVGYGGELPSSETAIATGLPASIQLNRERGRPKAGLPGDVAENTFWKVLIPASAAANGVIRSRDIITDDLGIRYQVEGSYFNSLGYNILAERLES